MKTLKNTIIAVLIAAGTAFTGCGPDAQMKDAATWNNANANALSQSKQAIQRMKAESDENTVGLHYGTDSAEYAKYKLCKEVAPTKPANIKWCAAMDVRVAKWVAEPTKW